MSNEIFIGDETYNIRLNERIIIERACIGDQVKFSRSVFSGSYGNAVFSGYKIAEGRITNASYGKIQKQLTYTLELVNAEKTFIKEKNLYKNGCFRRKWDDEKERDQMIELMIELMLELLHKNKNFDYSNVKYIKNFFK